MHKNSLDGHEVPYSPKLQDNLYEDTHPVPVQDVIRLWQEKGQKFAISSS